MKCCWGLRLHFGRFGRSASFVRFCSEGLGVICASIGCKVGGVYDFRDLLLSLSGSREWGNGLWRLLLGTI